MYNEPVPSPSGERSAIPGRALATSAGMCYAVRVETAGIIITFVAFMLSLWFCLASAPTGEGDADATGIADPLCACGYAEYDKRVKRWYKKWNPRCPVHARPR